MPVARRCLLAWATLAILAVACDEAIGGPVIGIDLGITFSCAGIYKNGLVEIISNDQGNRITPSYVAFTDVETLVGEAAKNQSTLNPLQTVFDVKRLIGRRFQDSVLQKDIKLLPFSIVEQGGKPHISVKINGEQKSMTPEEVSSIVLVKMKDMAESYLGMEVKHALITVPAYFNDAQRQSTKDAGALSGLNVLRIINEPVAAAVAYGLDKKSEQNILVYDLGGGTFDVSLLTIDDGVFDVLATSGDTHLGGEDIVQRVMQHFIQIFNKKHNKDMSTDSRALQKVRWEVERTIRALNSADHARVEIEALFDGVDFSEILTRARFEEINSDLFIKTLGPVEQVLEDSGLTKNQIDEIVLVGGSTRTPKVQQLLKEFFNGKEPNQGINPDEVVAYGAAILAGSLNSQPFRNYKGRLVQELTEEMIMELEQFTNLEPGIEERVAAKKAFGDYIHMMRSVVEGSGGNKRFIEKLDSEENEKIIDALKDGQSWLDSNPEADVEEIAEKHKEVEGICAPVVSTYDSASASGAEEDQAEINAEP